MSDPPDLTASGQLPAPIFQTAFSSLEPTVRDASAVGRLTIRDRVDVRVDASRSGHLVLTSAAGGNLQVGGSFPTGSFTQAAWIRWDATDPYAQAIRAQQGGNGDSAGFIMNFWNFYIGQNQFRAGFTSERNWGNMMSWMDIVVGQWHHVALTFDGATRAQKLYVDGALFASSTSGEANPGFPDDGSPDIFLANFSGALDDVRLYDTVLSAAQVGLLHAGVGRVADAVVLVGVTQSQFWRFNVQGVAPRSSFDVPAPPSSGFTYYYFFFGASAAVVSPMRFKVPSAGVTNLYLEGNYDAGESQIMNVSHNTWYILTFVPATSKWALSDGTVGFAKAQGSSKWGYELQGLAPNYALAVEAPPTAAFTEYVFNFGSTAASSSPMRFKLPSDGPTQVLVANGVQSTTLTNMPTNQWIDLVFDAQTQQWSASPPWNAPSIDGVVSYPMPSGDVMSYNLATMPSGSELAVEWQDISSYRFDFGARAASATPMRFKLPMHGGRSETLQLLDAGQQTTLVGLGQERWYTLTFNALTRQFSAKIDDENIGFPIGNNTVWKYDLQHAPAGMDLLLAAPTTYLVDGEPHFGSYLLSFGGNAADTMRFQLAPTQPWDGDEPAPRPTTVNVQGADGENASFGGLKPNGRYKLTFNATRQWSIELENAFLFAQALAGVWTYSLQAMPVGTELAVEPLPAGSSSVAFYFGTSEIASPMRFKLPLGGPTQLSLSGQAAAATLTGLVLDRWYTLRFIDVTRLWSADIDFLDWRDREDFDMEIQEGIDVYNFHTIAKGASVHFSNANDLRFDFGSNAEAASPMRFELEDAVKLQCVESNGEIQEIVNLGVGSYTLTFNPATRMWRAVADFVSSLTYTTGGDENVDTYAPAEAGDIVAALGSVLSQWGVPLAGLRACMSANLVLGGSLPLQLALNAAGWDSDADFFSRDAAASAQLRALFETAGWTIVGYQAGVFDLPATDESTAGVNFGTFRAFESVFLQQDGRTGAIDIVDGIKFQQNGGTGNYRYRRNVPEPSMVRIHNNDFYGFMWNEHSWIASPPAGNTSRPVQCWYVGEIFDAASVTTSLREWLRDGADMTATGCSWDGSQLYVPFANLSLSSGTRVAYLLERPKSVNEDGSFNSFRGQECSGRASLRIVKYAQRGFEVRAPPSVGWEELYGYFQAGGLFLPMQINTALPENAPYVDYVNDPTKQKAVTIGFNGSAVSGVTYSAGDGGAPGGGGSGEGDSGGGDSGDGEGDGGDGGGQAVPPPPQLLRLQLASSGASDATGRSVTVAGKITVVADAQRGTLVLDVPKWSSLRFSGGMPAGSFSACGWVTYKSQRGYGALIGADSPGASMNKWYLWHFDDISVRGSVTDDASYAGWYYASAQSPEPLALNTWYHLGMTFDDATRTLTVYVNGQVKGWGVVASKNAGVLGDALFIGGELHGRVHDVRVYGGVLDQAQIAAAMAGQEVPSVSSAPPPKPAQAAKLSLVSTAATSAVFAVRFASAASTRYAIEYSESPQFVGTVTKAAVAPASVGRASKLLGAVVSVSISGLPSGRAMWAKLSYVIAGEEVSTPAVAFTTNLASRVPPAMLSVSDTPASIGDVTVKIGLAPLCTKHIVYAVRSGVPAVRAVCSHLISVRGQTATVNLSLDAGFEYELTVRGVQDASTYTDSLTALRHTPAGSLPIAALVESGGRSTLTAVDTATDRVVSSRGDVRRAQGAASLAGATIQLSGSSVSVTLTGASNTTAATIIESRPSSQVSLNTFISYLSGGSGDVAEDSQLTRMRALSLLELDANGNVLASALTSDSQMRSVSVAVDNAVSLLTVFGLPAQGFADPVQADSLSTMRALTISRQNTLATPARAYADSANAAWGYFDAAASAFVFKCQFSTIFFTTATLGGSSGVCFGAGTRLLAADGTWREAATIHAGTLLRTVDGRAVPVLEVSAWSATAPFDNRAAARPYALVDNASVVVSKQHRIGRGAAVLRAELAGADARRIFSACRASSSVPDKSPDFAELRLPAGYVQRWFHFRMPDWLTDWLCLENDMYSESLLMEQDYGRCTHTVTEWIKT